MITYDLKLGQIKAKKFDGRNLLPGMGRMCAAFMVRTERGVMRIYNGDYLVRLPGGSLTVMLASDFEKIAGVADGND